ncbi:MAG: sulfatase-like hydrolase/transferase [Rhodopirellula sp.]|nr:sulfatase-like hydrolase/transferase [Rhodopirellula sp.]
MYKNTAVPIPVSLVRKPEQIPAWGKPTGVKPAQLQILKRSYYGMVKYIDDNIGQVLDALRERQLLARTIIVFTSDRGDLCGDLCGEPGRLSKGVPYEGSARIPFLGQSGAEVQPGSA